MLSAGTKASTTNPRIRNRAKPIGMITWRGCIRLAALVSACLGTPAALTAYQLTGGSSDGAKAFAAAWFLACLGVFIAGCKPKPQRMFMR